MNKTILLGLLSSSLLISQSANSADIAIGALIGQSSFDDICSVSAFDNCDDDDTSYGFNLAYNFNKVWGIELGYSDLGTYGGSDSSVGSILSFLDSGAITQTDVVFEASENFDLTALYLAVNASYYFNDKFSVTGRLGVTELDLDFTISASSTSTDTFFNSSDSESFSDSSTEAFYGISLNYNFTGALQAQFRYDLYEGDIDNLSLGLRYSFGL